MGKPTRSNWVNSRRLFVLVLALALLLPALARPAGASPVTPAPDLAAIDRYVEEQLRTLRIPGASLGIVHGDRIVHLRGFGRADGAGSPMTPQTPSLIGSLTKSFTAVGIMQLVEQGKIELDAPVQRYLPWFRVADAEASTRITVRHLLTHSSGLPRDKTTDSISREDTRPDAIERQVRALATVELAHPVGSASEYANTGYITLGLILETVSGRSYEEYVRQQIFAPLQMDESFTSPVEARDHGLAEGHQFWFGQPRPARLPYPRGLLPAGFLVSSAEDMSRYLIAHLNGGRVGDARILSPEGVAELHRPAISDGEGGWGAMDWGVFDAEGVRILQHTGDTANYVSDVYMLPDTGWGFVLLMNASNSFQRSGTVGIGRGVATLLMGQQPQAVAWSSAGQLIIGVMVAIVGLQLLGIARSIRKLRRWPAAPAKQVVWWKIVLPLVANALLGLLFLVVVPMVLLRAPLPSIVFSAPDLGYTLVIAGVLALGWALVRTALVLRPAPRHIAVTGQAALSHS